MFLKGMTMDPQEGHHMNHIPVQYDEKSQQENSSLIGYYQE
jgi:hypothetical protein